MVCEYLERRGYRTTQVENGQSLERALPGFPDVSAVLLDVNMPDEDGLSILRRRRADWSFPVIMLTAVDEVVDKIIGLEMGADDYLVKPVDLRELEARLKVVLNRGPRLDPSKQAPGGGRKLNKRHLAVILAMDVVGYSAMMRRNAKETVTRLLACRAMLANEADRHGGRTFGAIGDSILAEFLSPVDAIRCAIDIQTHLSEQSGVAPSADSMQLRIGAYLGDVIEEAGNLYGNGVNIAARLESVCQPQGVCLADNVRVALEPPLPQKPTPLREVYQSLKDNVFPYQMGNIHPRFWMWYMGSSNFTGALGDFLAAILGSNLGGGNHAASQIDQQVVNWMKEMMGFPPEASGTLVSGGSMANIIGLTVARNQKAGIDVRQHGVAA